MSRYTLKSFCDDKQMERFDHRSKSKLLGLLDQPKHHEESVVGAWGDVEVRANRFEIFDSQMTKVFNGSITDAMIFARKLK